MRSVRPGSLRNTSTAASFTSSGCLALALAFFWAASSLSYCAAASAIFCILARRSAVSATGAGTCLLLQAMFWSALSAHFLFAAGAAPATWDSIKVVHYCFFRLGSRCASASDSQTCSTSNQFSQRAQHTASPRAVPKHYHKHKVFCTGAFVSGDVRPEQLLHIHENH